MRVSPRLVLAAAVAAQAAVSIVQFGLPAIGPELREAFGLSLAALGAVLTVNLLGAGLTLFAAGIAVDRYGARAVTAGGTALSAAALTAAAFAADVQWLLAALLLAGVGSAAVPIAGAASLFRAYPPARRGWAMGVRQMAVALGGTIAAILSSGSGGARGRPPCTPRGRRGRRARGHRLRARRGRSPAGPCGLGPRRPANLECPRHAAAPPRGGALHRRAPGPADVRRPVDP